MWFQLTFVNGDTARACSRQELWYCAAEGLVEKIDICRLSNDAPDSSERDEHVIEATLMGMDVCEHFIGLVSL